jgi:hypothetical protein
MDRQTDDCRYIALHRQMGTGTHGRTDRQTDRQRMHGKMTDEWTDRQADVYLERRTDRQLTYMQVYGWRDR